MKIITKLTILRKYRPALTTKARYIIIMGGRGAGRSYFASQLISILIKKLKYFRCAVMRFILGDVRISIFQEILDRFTEQGADDVYVSDLDIKYNGNLIKGLGFRKSSNDQKSKLKSLANFNFIVIEEADEILEDDFRQLDDSLRTVNGDIKIILLLNPPPKNHWIIKRWFNLVATEVEGFFMPQLKTSESHNTLFIHTTYKNNAKNISQTTKENYERYKTTNPDYYWNMIAGYVSAGARGRIYKDWQPISQEEYDKLDYRPFYGGDFGFTNDPTALVEIKMHNDDVYVKELLYQTGLINSRIAKRLEEMKIGRTDEQYWDSAEPKSIEELKQMDWNVRGTVKGAGSRKSGVSLLLGKRVHYVESSENIIKEKDAYCWALDKNKEPTNEPSDGNDHLMDAIRGAVYTKINDPYFGVM